MISWISLVLMTSGGIGMIVTAMKDYLIPFIITVACFLSGFLLVIYGVCEDNKEKYQQDLITWNDGYHENCGGRWEFCQIEYGYKAQTTGYIYKCDKCYKIESFSNIME